MMIDDINIMNPKGHSMRRSAFTMLELVFVIVVLGILAALALPRLDRDLKQEAADSILSDIRYTQHLALIDNKHRFDESSWQSAFWQTSFESCGDGGQFVGITSDMNYNGSTNQAESATDPANGKPMFLDSSTSCKTGGGTTISDRIFITKKYGITAVNGTGGCDDHIGFDHLGRPHVGFLGSGTPNNSSYMSTACTFTFTMSDTDTFAITIEPETGHAFIVGQEGS